MARIVIDDDWFTDPRRFKLAEILGSETLADGTMLIAWKLAQDFWRRGKRLVPAPVFNKIPNAKEVFDVGLAKHKGASIYVNGSSVRFQWLINQSTKGKAGGLASGRSRREKNEANAKQTRSKREPSSSSSSSSSSLNTKNIYTGRDFLEEAIGEWGITLESFGIKKPASFDEVPIQRLIARYGVEQTMLALRGARLEAKTESYDPAKHCSISRISRPAVFDKFVNLGSQPESKPAEFEREA